MVVLLLLLHCHSGSKWHFARAVMVVIGFCAASGTWPETRVVIANNGQHLWSLLPVVTVLYTGVSTS
jgi:hypothetical protein